MFSVCEQSSEARSSSASPFNATWQCAYSNPAVEKFNERNRLAQNPTLKMQTAAEKTGGSVQPPSQAQHPGHWQNGIFTFAECHTHRRLARKIKTRPAPRYWLLCALLPLLLLGFAPLVFGGSAVRTVPQGSEEALASGIFFRDSR